MLLFLGQFLGFLLSPAPSASSFACASHGPAIPSGSTVADTIIPLKLLVLRQSLPPCIPCLVTSLLPIIFPTVLSSVTCPAPSQAPSAGSLLSSKKSWHSSEGGIQARISPLPFQRYGYEPGPTYLSRNSNSFLNPRQLSKILSNPGFNCAKIPLKGKICEKPCDFNPKLELLSM